MKMSKDVKGDLSKKKIKILTVSQCNSLSDKYSWESFETPYSLSYGLNSTNFILLGALFGIK